MFILFSDVINKNNLINNIYKTKLMAFFSFACHTKIVSYDINIKIITL